MYFEMKNVVVQYDRVLALKEVSIQLEEREIVTLIGANGAGKSTTMRSIMGMTKIHSGEIWFTGQRIDVLPTPKIVALGIAEVPEGRQVYPYMSVLDNLRMGAYLRHDRKKIRKDLERIYGFFPILKERIGQQGGSLSGGEQQQLALGRALMTRPKLLLMDEPSLGLSPILVKGVAKTITMLNREEDISFIVVEQNARMALRIADKGYVLETGKVALEDQSSRLIDNDYVRKIYLGG